MRIACCGVSVPVTAIRLGKGATNTDRLLRHAAGPALADKGSEPAYYAAQMPAADLVAGIFSFVLVHGPVEELSLARKADRR